MRNLVVSVAAAMVALSVGPALAEPPLVGIVSITATEANNARYISGAQAAAKEMGWNVSVIDAAGSADQANASIQNFAQRGAAAIVDMVFPFSSIGAGLAAAKSANIPVVTWGGGIGSTVAATNGSGAPIAQPVIDKMVADLKGKGDILALTYRTGEVCRNREVLMDQVVAKASGRQIKYVDVPPAAAQDGMLKTGMPSAYVDALLELYAFMKSGGAAMTTTTVQELLGRPAVSFEQWAANHAASRPVPAPISRTRWGAGGIRWRMEAWMLSKDKDS